MAKQKRTFSKTDVRHWQGGGLFKNTFTREGVQQKTNDWCMRLQHKAHRGTINLRTPNKDDAAREAVVVYKLLLTGGWEAVQSKYKPKAPEVPPAAATVGALIENVSAMAGYGMTTLTTYTQSLRTIAAGIAGIHTEKAGDAVGSSSRKKSGQKVHLVDHRQGPNRLAWLAKVNAVPLTIFTPENVEAWRLGRLKNAGGGADAQQRAENTANSQIRNARALFSEKALKLVRGSMILPVPLPFNGVTVETKSRSRYRSKIDAETLIVAARNELSKKKASIEQYKLFCLGMFCGLRKAEADSLTWNQVDFKKQVIRIEPTSHFAPKNEESIDSVDLEPDMVSLLKGWKAKAKSTFVVESPVAPRESVVKGKWYRCQTDFKRLYTWLKGKGITASKPYHELRKEVGSLIAKKQGIYAAMHMLRHGDIATTAKYYADKKGPITTGLGHLLSDEVEKESDSQ